MNGKGYKAILILVVGLTAFSSAMKELNQLREFGAEAGQFVAEWSEKLVPAESPTAVPPVVVAKSEKCQSKVSEPNVELPWLEHVADADQIADTEEPAAAPQPVIKRTRAKRERQGKVDPVPQFEVRILNDQAGELEVPAVPVVSKFTVPPATFTFKSHKQSFNFYRLNPRDREMLKTLNRSINLRSAG
jgi:hypothetical protein